MDAPRDVEDNVVESLDPAWMPWSGELPKQRQAFEDYYAQDPPRSVQALLAFYHAEHAKRRIVPSTAIKTLGAWHRRFLWEERAAQRDQALRRGWAKPDGTLTRAGVTREKTVPDESVNDATKQELVNIFWSRLRDPKTSASALPGLKNALCDLLGIPVHGNDSLEAVTGLPPGQDRLTFAESEFIYRRMTQAQVQAVEEILDRRERRLNPQPMEMHEELAEGPDLLAEEEATSAEPEIIEPEADDPEPDDPEAIANG